MRGLVGLVAGIVLGGVAGFFVGERARDAAAKAQSGSDSHGMPLREPRESREPREPIDGPRAPQIDAARSIVRRDAETNAAPVPADPSSAPPSPPAAAAAAEPPVLDDATRAELSDLREQLTTAGSAERTRLLQEALRRASTGTPQQRAAILAEIFKSDGWFREKAGPAFDDAVWNLSAATLKELPPGKERDALVGLLSEQMERARGVDAMSEMLGLVRANVADERARLEQHAGAPSESAVRALRDLLNAAVDADPDAVETGLVSSTAFGLAGPNASAEDRATLMALADRAKSPTARLAGIAALGSTPDDATVDGFLARLGQQTTRSWSERAIAWQVLRRRGHEDLLPVAVRDEILDAWAASGVANLEGAFDK